MSHKQTKESATEKEIGTKETAQIKPLITRNTIRVVLSLEPASVQKDKKWQASLGENNAIDVAIKDESFLKRNDYRLDRFGKDDLLEVDLQATQTVVDGRITVDYAVLRVHEHKALSIPETHLKFFV